MCGVIEGGMRGRRTVLLAGLVFTVSVTDCGTNNASSPTCENVTPAITKAAESQLRNDSLTGKTAGATSLVREASRELNAVKETHYTHVAAVDESRGQFDYDCSSFLAYALQRALPRAYDEIVATHPAPKTRDFVDEFTNVPSKGSQFVRVPHGLDLRPGDIVAWLLPPGSDDTGHIAIVAGTPSVSADRGDELLVPVVDSTSRLHGIADTRGAGGGLGLGTIGLLVDDVGNLVGHRWAGGCGDTKAELTVAVRPR